MQTLLDPTYKYAWAVVLALALYLAGRGLVYRIYRRRAERQLGELDEQDDRRVRRQASFATVLLAFALAFIYVKLAAPPIP